MKCVFCRVGDTNPGATTFTVDRDGTLFVLRNIPADVCDACGEGYFDEDIAREVERMTDEALESGEQVVIREFREAC